MLNQSSIFGKCTLLLILLISGSVNLNAQFDSIIFARNDIYAPKAVIYMGDQNDDGCDDFVLVTYPSTWGYDAKALIFYGGEPIHPDTAFSISFRGYIPNHISACDFNRDGYRDLVLTSFNIKPVVIKIYCGGPQLDTIPDFTFRPPDNSVGSLTIIGGDWPVDFNGDGYEEIIVRAYEMFDRKSAFLLYNSSTEMDSIPDQIVTYYPDEAIQGNDITTGDLDGDGRTDLTFTLTGPSIPVNFVLRRFVFGREDFSFEDTVNFLDSFYLVGNNNIIRDINKDGKDDLLTHDGQQKYPYWYRLGISYGSRDLNITPEEGFNTQNEGWTYSQSIGDVNGDCYGDFLTSLSYSGGRLFLGGKHKLDDTPIKYYSGLTNIIARVGDVNGDGLDDIGIGTNGGPGAAQGTFYIMAGERVAMAVEDEADGLTTPYEIDLTISPNPTNGPVTLQYTLPGPGELVTEVFNILGEKIYSSSSQGETGVHSEQIDLASRAGTSGVYILRVSLSSGGKSYSKSVKVQVVK